MSGGYEVKIDALRGYVENLGSYQEQTGKFTEFVAESDVGDESWGLVGLMTKSGYTEMLGELTGLLANMADGLASASDKFGAAADGYQHAEDEFSRLLQGFLDRAEDATAGDPPSGRATN